MALRSTLLLLLITSGRSDHNKEYILNSQKCKIPDIPPQNQEVQNIIIPQKYLPCNESELLSYIRKKEDKKSAVLHLRRDLTSGNVRCCYSYVTRNGSLEEPDVGISFTPCLDLQEQQVLEKEVIYVTCVDKIFNVTYRNVHHPVVIKKSIKRKLRSSEVSKPFSVLFIVVDSVSRLNFIRTMNQTYGYLKENGFIEMKGYTKVADNTYPNFISLLTGLNSIQSRKKCNPHKVGGLDNCPMIWYGYRNHGYITAYAEDDAPISTFNWEKKGFRNPPTDYYFKPYIEASERLGVRSYNNMPYCSGPETAGERILNLAKDFSTTFKDQASFGVFWMNTFSHNDINAPFVMDEKMKQFFQDMKSEGVLNETIVFLLSDHGFRYGNIRITKSGWHEERMPVNMISIPKKFRRLFRSEYTNLVDNSQKLTSTYDLYMTLQHILTLSETTYEVKPSLACPKCLSLFKKIPTDRTCRDAGIPTLWCPCLGHFQSLPLNHTEVQKAIEIVTQKIKRSCRNVKMDRFITASISDSVPSEKNVTIMFLAFETNNNIVLVNVMFSQTINRNSTFNFKTISNLEKYC